MRILLDSHTLVWFLTGNAKLSERAGEVIAAPESEVFVSAASAWEIATKVRAGKWGEADQIARDLAKVIFERDFSGLPITIEHGHLAGFLAGEHRDPFDRMLAAQAITEQMPLVTADPAFRSFPVTVLW